MRSSNNFQIQFYRKQKKENYFLDTLWMWFYQRAMRILMLRSLRFLYQVNYLCYIIKVWSPICSTIPMLRFQGFIKDLQYRHYIAREDVKCVSSSFNNETVDKISEIIADPSFNRRAMPIKDLEFFFGNSQTVKDKTINNE